MSPSRSLPSLVVLALVLSACGAGTAAPAAVSTSAADATSPTTPTTAGDDSATAAGGPAATAAVDDDGLFPVTIEHRFGSTTVESRPERVVSVGFNDHDTILALGTVPVAAREWYGEFPSATWEWATDELGDAEMAVLDGEELDFERIAELDPDLIVGIFSGMTEDDHALLSQIGPTIASPADYPDFGTPWQEVTRIYGGALGVPDEAERIVDDLDQRFADIREEHPAFRDAEAVTAFFAGGEIGAYVSEDLRSRVLADLGFTIPAEIDEAAGEGAFFLPLSLEQADMIDREAVVWVTATPEEIEALQALPVRDTLQAAQEGREVFTDFTTNGAFSFSSPLSIPYLLDRIVPALEAAVDGDPATEVRLADA